MKGTAAYLAPEQARGESASPRSDLHAVGVILYQVLTMRLPYEAATAGELIASILRDEAPEPAEVGRASWSVPPELSLLTRRLLAKDPAERPASAREVAEELRAFLEGVRDRERRDAAAAELADAARAALDAHERTEAELEALAGEVARLEDEHPPWQAVADKLPLIDAQAMTLELQRSSWRSFLEGVHRYTDALVHVPDHAQVRAALADQFWTRFTEAEARGEEALADTCRLLVERWHDGRYAAELEGHGRIELELEPKDAELVLHPLVEKNLLLVDGPGRPLGRGDLELDGVAMGSYVLVATAPGHEPARYPICIRRCETWQGRLSLPKEGELPEGFVFVPGTRAWLGGDPAANNAWPRRQVELESFAIGRHAVRFADWCAFLDERGPEASAGLVPSIDPLGALCRWDEERGAHVPLAEVDCSAEFLELHGREALARVPVFGVNLEMVGVYCEWLGGRLGRPVALPTGEQWELAARGVDERRHPWGMRFDAALCRVRDSTAGEAYVPPVGAAAADCSVHGVRDLAGTIQEWTSSLFAESGDYAEVRGGGWQAGRNVALSAWRGACDPAARSSQLGFRVVVPMG